MKETKVCRDVLHMKHLFPDGNVFKNTDENGNVINEFYNTKIAGKEIGVHPSNISRACNIKGRITAGYMWKYA